MISMITINLLPEEKRYRERTPLPRFLLLNAAIIMLLLLLFWNGYMWMTFRDKEASLKIEREALAALQAKTTDFDKKVAEEQELSGWGKSVNDVIVTRPFVWWEAIDYLWDLVTGTQSIWVTSLRGEEGSGSGSKQSLAQVGYNMNFGALSATDDVEKMNDFRIKLRHSPELIKIFDLGFQEKPNKIKQAMPDYKEEYALKFDIELQRAKPAPKP